MSKSAEDGEKIGKQLLSYVGDRSGTKAEAVSGFLKSNKPLQEVVQQFNFFEQVIVAIVDNKFSRLSFAKIEGAAENLGYEDGKRIGSSLAIALALNLTAGGAVDEWILQYPSLQEVEESRKWLRPMFITIAQNLLGEVSWGLKLRTSIGAASSIVDLLTDVYMTYTFWVEEKHNYFKASVICLTVSLSLQLLMISLQYKRLGWKRVLRECFPILIAFKPAVDAYRIAKGVKKEAGNAADPMFELITMCCCEIFAEAIPGVIIQVNRKPLKPSLQPPQRNNPNQHNATPSVHSATRFASLAAAHGYYNKRRQSCICGLAVFGGLGAVCWLHLGDYKL